MRLFEGLLHDLDKKLAKNRSFYETYNQHIAKLPNSLDNNNETLPIPWQHVNRVNQLINRTSRLRKEWWKALERSQCFQTISEACILFDRAILPNDFLLDEANEVAGIADCFSLEHFANQTQQEPIIPFQGLPIADLIVAVEYIDGYAIVFYLNSNSCDGWRPIPIRRSNHFEYDCGNVSLQDELCDYCDIDAKELTNNALVIINLNNAPKSAHSDRLGSLRIYESSFSRHEIIYPQPGTIHVDLTFDWLSIGLPLRDKIHWRFFPEWSLRRWIEHTLGECTPELERISKRVLRENVADNIYSVNQASRQINPEDLHIPELIAAISQLVPDNALRVCLSGWLDTKLVTETLEGIFDSQSENAKWVSGEGPQLSLWKYCLMDKYFEVNK